MRFVVSHRLSFKVHLAVVASSWTGGMFRIAGINVVRLNIENQRILGFRYERNDCSLRTCELNE